MKQEILETIFSVYAVWAAPLPVACTKGCATCCTLNVSMTWLEGQRIHRFVKANRMEEWFACRLAETGDLTQPQLTVNAFAKACLEGVDIDLGPGAFGGTCPFLEGGLCCIYEVRPFGCIGFASQIPCTSGQYARVPSYYMAATTAIGQIIEHLDCGNPWGNMISVLLALSEAPAFRKVAEVLDDPETIRQNRTACLTAQPLPGFLIGNEEQTQVFPLLEKIYGSRIGGERLEDILNGGESP